LYFKNARNLNLEELRGAAAMERLRITALSYGRKV
jgi:hypothetical protein